MLGKRETKMRQGALAVAVAIATALGGAPTALAGGLGGDLSTQPTEAPGFNLQDALAIAAQASEGGRRVIQVSLGGTHSAAIKSDGSLWT